MSLSSLPDPTLQGADIVFVRAGCLLLLCAGLISKSQALMRLKPELIDQLLHPTLDPKAKKQVIAKAGRLNDLLDRGWRSLAVFARADVIGMALDRLGSLWIALWIALRCAQGLPASPGAAAGKVVFTADEARLVDACVTSGPPPCIVPRQSAGPRMVRRCCWCGSRPARTTSTACTQQRVS